MTGLISFNLVSANGIVTPQVVSAATPLPITGTVIITAPAAGLSVFSNGRYYQNVAASQTAVGLGPTGGALGDTLDNIWIFPNSLTVTGSVTILDNATVVWSWPAAQVLQNLAPIFVPLNYKSRSGAFKATTSTNVSIEASGTLT